MAVLALLTIVGWLIVLGAMRGVLHQRAGGAPAIRSADPAGSPQWWARLLGTAGFASVVAGPVAELLGLAPIQALDQLALRIGGWILAILGMLLSVRGQLAMGEAWRGDVDPDARTTLVTEGPFHWVRNPIFTGTSLTWVGLALLVPNPITIAGAGLALASHQVQVRLVEEPYLRRVHGDAYGDYAAHTGRFLPGIGRIREG